MLYETVNALIVLSVSVRVSLIFYLQPEATYQILEVTKVGGRIIIPSVMNGELSFQEVKITFYRVV